MKNPRVAVRDRVPSWGLVSAAAAPVLLVGGWTVAASRQVPAVDPTVVTISALAAREATDRWLMTAALAGVGACHAVTALALRPAAPAGRALLAVGGAGTLGVAGLPLAEGADSTPHAVAAAVAFAALAVWPAFARRRPAPAPVLAAPASAAATAVLVGLLGWFVVELAGGVALPGGAGLVGGDRVGAAERVAAAAQAAWPLVVVLALRRRRRPR